MSDEKNDQIRPLQEQLRAMRAADGNGDRHLSPDEIAAALVKSYEGKPDQLKKFVDRVQGALRFPELNRQMRQHPDVDLIDALDKAAGDREWVERQLEKTNGDLGGVLQQNADFLAGNPKVDGKLGKLRHEMEKYSFTDATLNDLAAALPGGKPTTSRTTSK